MGSVELSLNLETDRVMSMLSSKGVLGGHLYFSSLVPRPSSPPVFDRLQYAKMASDQKLEPGKAWEGGYIFLLLPTLSL